MNTTVTKCDSCVKTSDNPHLAGWIFILARGITKSYRIQPNQPQAEKPEFINAKTLDFCSWRCFRKYWRGKK